LLAATAAPALNRAGRIALASPAAYEPPSVQKAWQAFTGSFQAVYGSSKGWEFVGIQVLVFLVLVVVTVCTCGLGALVAVPVSTFYLQNAAYHKGVLS
jgi:hypothetical protein